MTVRAPKNVDAVACVGYGGERECSIAASCRYVGFEAGVQAQIEPLCRRPQVLPSTCAAYSGHAAGAASSGILLIMARLAGRGDLEHKHVHSSFPSRARSRVSSVVCHVAG